MKRSLSVGLFLLLAYSAWAAAQQKCPSIDTSMLDKGFPEFAPWRVMSGGPGQCSFTTKNSSINFGFSHSVSSLENTVAGAASMKDAVAPTSVVEAFPALGEKGIAYQPKNKAGQVERTTMFFYGYRGNVSVSGYLNLKEPITPAQRDLAGNLIAATLRVADSPKAVAKEINCRYLDTALAQRLLPGADLAIIVPDANNCVVSAGGKVITVAVTKNTGGWPAAERLLKSGGCKVDALPNLGKGAGIAHHCTEGNPRAEVAVVAGSRVYKVLFVPTGEPSAEERATLVELAKFAAKN